MTVGGSSSVDKDVVHACADPVCGTDRRRCSAFWLVADTPGAWRSAGWVSGSACRVDDAVEGFLCTRGIVTVGLGQILEVALAAHDRDCGIGQAGEVTG